MTTFIKGNAVIITRSIHADVPNGTEGVIEDVVSTGYGVVCTANFSQNGGGWKSEERCIFVEKDGLKAKEAE